MSSTSLGRRASCISAIAPLNLVAAARAEKYLLALLRGLSAFLLGPDSVTIAAAGNAPVSADRANERDG